VESTLYGFSKNNFKKFSKKLAVCHFPNGIGSEGENHPAFLSARKGVNSVELTSSQMETISYQFESFGKKVIREHYRDLMRKMCRQSENEIAFSELTEREMDSLFAVDDYPAEHFHFYVDGEDVVITDERLYNALSDLPSKRRDILLMAVCFEQSDAKIAKKLNMVRSTVQNQRTSSLAKLITMMGG